MTTEFLKSLVTLYLLVFCFHNARLKVYQSFSGTPIETINMYFQD